MTDIILKILKLSLLLLLLSVYSFFSFNYFQSFHSARCLRKLVVIKETRQTTNQRAKNRGVELLKFDDVERLGAQKNHPEVPPKSTDLCTISYTSGTTGNPKGVMLTHQNVIAGISAVLVQLGEHKPSYKDTMISFLPLAHMLERCCENGMYMVGGSVGFYSGDIKRLSEDMKALRPTVMPAVPRLLNRMYDKVGCLIITSIESYYN